MSARTTAIALALATALGLAGCGGAAEPAGDTGGTTADAAFPRTVEHAMGATEIPDRPRRVVVLDTGELDSALSLGVTPVGAVTTDVVLYSSFGAAEESGETEIVAGPLWPRLQAVQEDRAHAVEDDVFYTGIGLTAATLIVEDLADRLG